MGRIRDAIIEVMDEKTETEKCFVCGEVIRGEGISRPIDRPGGGRSEYRRFHPDCWDLE